MTAFMLLRAVCDFLRESVSDYAAAQGEKGEYHIPEVFEWYLPFKNPKAHEKIDFPYIVARINEGQDIDDLDVGSTVRVDFAFGVYRESESESGVIHPDGAYDLLAMMEHIRLSLFKQRIVDQKFRIEKPYKWQIPEEQPYPLWVGQAQTIWTVHSVLEEIEGVDLHGHNW